MIPGTPATPIPRIARRSHCPSNHDLLGARTTNWKLHEHPGRSRALAQFLLPRPDTADRCALYRFVAVDLIVLLAACLLLSFACPAWSLSPDAIPVYAVLVTLFGFSEGLYRTSGQAAFAKVTAPLTKAVLFAMFLVFITARNGTLLPAFPATFAASIAVLLTWRYLRTLRWKGRTGDSESRRVLIVGAGPSARAIAQSLRDDPAHQVVIRGFVDDDLPRSPEVLGRIEDLDWLARAEFVDEVILALPNQPGRVREAAEAAYRNHLDILAVPDLPPGPWPDAGIDRIGEVPVITLHREELPGVALFLKRLLDIAGALVGLVLAAPLMAIVALLIRLDSPGPVIYSAARTGAKGRRFPCFKFRSMVSDADQLKENLRARNQREGPIFKIDDDPRITRVGRFLRRYSLDELPQLWNVLRGDMSLVGPRPHPVDEVSHYELHHYRRLDVKPGLTGLWQVTARKNPSFDLGMHLDLTYIENWTLLLDLRILMSTLRVFFAPEGA
jgi:exopolysaccharide biosynthesis polyprenyl glycosylphosphotransferase